MCCNRLLIICSVCCDYVQAELTFSAGDIIHVFGDMDEDGFFYVSVKRTSFFFSFFLVTRDLNFLPKSAAADSLNVAWFMQGQVEICLSMCQSKWSIISVVVLRLPYCVFQGDLNGHKGLVPSNFLQALPDDAPAERVCVQPAPEPKKEPQVALLFFFACTTIEVVDFLTCS